MPSNASLAARWRRLDRTSRQFLAVIPELLLVRYRRVLIWAVITGLVGVAAYLMLLHFVFDPPNLTVPEVKTITLDVNSIDELELWIEERDAERTSPIVGNSAGIFVALPAITQ